MCDQLEFHEGVLRSTIRSMKHPAHLCCKSFPCQAEVSKVNAPDPADMRHACSYRRGPTARELLQWASLARLLCERGWEASQVLATSWRQTYTRAESSPAGQAAAEAAFKEHCSGVSAETLDRQHDALALSLSRPASWPLPLAASDIAADSGVASWAASSAAMTHLLHQLMALEVLSLKPEQQSQLSDFSAAFLPAPWLQQRLRGTDDSISGAALVERLGGADACQAAVSQGVLLIQIAAGCLFERLSLQSVEHGIFWLQHVNQQVRKYQHRPYI